QRNTEINRMLFVYGVYRLDCGIENMGRIQHNRRICRRDTVFKAKIDRLNRRFFVGDMDVGYGKEIQKSCSISGRCTVKSSRHDVEPLYGIYARAIMPVAIALLLVS